MDTSNMHLPDWLARCAENLPHHLAIQCGEVRWSFAELDQRVTRLARQLATAGVCQGERVALLAANGLPYVVTVHALTRLRAILVPLNTRLTYKELEWQIRDVSALHLLSDVFHQGIAADIVQAIPKLIQGILLVEPETSDIVLGGSGEDSNVSLYSLIDLGATQAIMYTSGTTGNPKGVIVTYGMQWWNAVGSALNLGHYRDDCWLACLPLFHIGGLSILFRSIIYGISVILHEKFDAAAVNRAIYEEHVTIISVVAVMLQRMLDESKSQRQYPSTLRCVLLGGGPAPRSLLEDCVARTIPVVQTYGLTEACSQAVTLAPADALRKLGSAGRPLPQVQLLLLKVDSEDQPVAVGEPGMIYLKGPSITPGYADRPEATAEVIRDGWLCTGDIGYLDEESYLYVLDRRSDLIISGGENVYPAEIESVLLSHPDVAEAGVCGQADAQWGQVPIAFVRLRAGHDAVPEALLAYASQYLARYKIPRAIYLVDHLPRNSSGKLLRRELLVEPH
jgi:O-succinylbenzoic acid--CoA ligase